MSKCKATNLKSSFLFRVSEIEGLKLARPALVEGRYLHSAPHGELLLSPGFPEEPPVTYETALGRVLSPDFEQKCLAWAGILVLISLIFLLNLAIRFTTRQRKPA